MNDHIKIRAIDGLWVVRPGGAVLGQTRAALDCFRRGLSLSLKSPFRMVMYGGAAMAICKTVNMKSN